MGLCEIEVKIEKIGSSFGGGGDCLAYGVGRALATNGDKTAGRSDVWVLTVIDDRSSSTIVVPETACFPVPSSLEHDMALLAVPLAAALNVWDRLHLELGEIAVYTGGHHCSDLIGLVAVWRGGTPVIRLGNGSDGESVSVGTTIDLSKADPDEVLGMLRKRVEEKPGFAAVDLSGRPELIDVLFEAMPRWGRLMLAGRPQTPLTVDFYNNVHRKGATVVCDMFDPALLLRNKDRAIYLSAAFRLLENKERAEVCARVVRGHRLS
ncbi:MAG: hypothetical protein NNA18_09605 [Nitrospira sp.]|nr:hypothetical protein [Nitrospira sp.]